MLPREAAGLCNAHIGSCGFAREFQVYYGLLGSAGLMSAGLAVKAVFKDDANVLTSGHSAGGARVDYVLARQAIHEQLSAHPELIGQVLHLLWLAAGTVDRRAGTGGIEGATLQLEPLASDARVQRVQPAIAALAGVQAGCPGLTVSDAWALAAREAWCMWTQQLPAWKPGRLDAVPPGQQPNADAFQAALPVPDQSTLPLARATAAEQRLLWQRIGLSPEQGVALLCIADVAAAQLGYTGATPGLPPSARAALAAAASQPNAAFPLASACYEDEELRRLAQQLQQDPEQWKLAGASGIAICSQTGVRFAAMRGV